MKNIFPLVILAISLIISSCSTYVPVEYRSGGEFTAPRNSTIKIKDKEDKTLILQLKNEIIADGWWQYVNEGKADYEINIAEITKKVVEEYSTIDDRPEKPLRDATYRTDGTATINLNKKSDKNFVKTVTISASGKASSQRELPKKHGNMSLWPIVHAVLNYDPREDAIKAQNSFLEIDSDDEMEKNLTKSIIKKITPEMKFVKVELEDGHEDMKSLKEYLKSSEVNMAFNYLQQLEDKDSRSDVQYNLGVIQEMRQAYSDACEYYQKAYNLKSKKLYHKQKVACEVRKLENLNLSQIK